VPFLGGVGLEIGSCYVDQGDLKLMIFLSQPPQCWDYRRVPPPLADFALDNGNIGDGHLRCAYSLSIICKNLCFAWSQVTHSTARLHFLVSVVPSFLLEGMRL
jgi:hypothetical protein